MPFTLAALGRAAANTNLSVAINNAGTPTAQGSFNVWTYNGRVANSSQAQIMAANYFTTAGAPYNDVKNSLANQFQVGDFILVYDNANIFSSYNVSAVVYPSATTVGLITLSFIALAGPVNTGNIMDNAVTYAKIQEVSAGTILGNSTNFPADVEEITLGNGLSFTGPTLQLSPDYLVHATVPVLAADWFGMFASPITIVPAPGIGNMVVVERVLWSLTAGVSQYTGGGPTGLQYGVFPGLTGIEAVAPQNNADINAAAVDMEFSKIGDGLFGTGYFRTDVDNAPITLSNLTAPYATGDGNWVVHCWYRVIQISLI